MNDDDDHRTKFKGFNRTISVPTCSQPNGRERVTEKNRKTK
jgi:hypothetical protein